MPCVQIWSISSKLFKLSNLLIDRIRFLNYNIGRNEWRCEREKGIPKHFENEKMIRAAFVELLGEKKNMETITVSELSERADVAKSTFYNHYDDVYAVAEEFEDELIDKLSAVFVEIEKSQATEYEDYIRKVIALLKSNDELYRKAILSSDIRFFIEKLKNIIAKKVYEERVNLPFSDNKKERYVQIRFLTNACVDTMVDYFRGMLELSLDEVGEIIIAMLSEYKR